MSCMDYDNNSWQYCHGEDGAKNDYPNCKVTRIGIAKGCVRSHYLN